LNTAIQIILGPILAALSLWLWISARKKRTELTGDHYSIRVVEEGRDPFDDRIEFHLRKRK